MKKLLQILFLNLGFCLIIIDGFAQPDFTTDGIPKAHNRKYFGLNGGNVNKLLAGYGDASLISNLALMRVKHVRHLAGTDAQYFNFLTGYPMTKAESINGYVVPNEYNESFQYAPNTLTLFKNSIASQGAEMVFDLNLITSKFNHQRAGIMNALALGQRIKAIEFGNEFFNDGSNGNRDFAYAFPYAEVYADSVVGWCKTLDDLFGTTLFPPKMIAIGADKKIDENPNNVGEDERINTWLPRLIAKIPWGQTYSPDGITIHRYTGSKYFDVNNVAKIVLDNNVSDMAKLLNTPRENFAKFNAPGAELSQISAVGAKAYLTEYGMSDSRRETHGTWAHGLFVALQTLTYLESDAIELVDFHSMVGNAMFSCIFPSTDGLNLPASFNDNWQETGIGTDDFEYVNGSFETTEVDFLDPTDYATIPGQKSAVGNALTLVGKALDDCNQKEKLIFNGTGQVGVIYPGASEVFYDKLYGWRLKGISGNFKYIIINNSADAIDITVPAGVSGTSLTYAANPREYIVGNAIAPPLPPVIDLNNFNDVETTPNHVPYKFDGAMVAGTTFTFKPYSITYVDGPYPATTILETLGGLCAPDMWTIGTTYTLKVANGVGPYTFTSSAPINAAGALLNITNTPNDYVTLPAYKTAASGSTPFVNTFTVKDWGKGGATGSLAITMLSKLSIDIVIGTSPTGTSAGSAIDACAAGCATLTATNIDGTWDNNRYQWYTNDGNKSFDSPGTTTYGDNGYSQTVTICPKQAEQKFYVIAYSGYKISGKDCNFAIDEITIKTPVAKANPEINDQANLYVCNTSPGNAINLGNPTPLGATYTYLWTPVGSVTGTTISSTTVATPTLTITSPSVTAVTYNVKVSLSSSCFNTNQVTVNPKKCCTTATADLAFKPYTTISQVKDAIALNSNCTNCVQDNTINNFDEIINFNGPLVQGENDPNEFSFIGCDNLQFAQDAYLSVQNGNTFILDNSKVDACTNILWRGLQAKTAMEEINVINGSSIKNSTYGIVGYNNAVITVKNSLFDKNLYHMYFTGYAGNFGDVSDQKGITGNTFTHSGGFLLAPYTATDRTNKSIYFSNCLGSLLIGGDPLAYNTINNTITGIQGYQSGISAKNNTISNFTYGVLSSDSRKYLNYLVQENSFSSNYYFTGSISFVESNNYGTAIYMTANASTTPDTISIRGNTITNSRQGIFMSKLNGKSLIVNLNGPYGGEIKENTITLFKDPDVIDDFTHKGIVLLENSGIDVVKNTIKTDPTTFSSLTPLTKIDKYIGIQASNQLLGCDYFSNTFTELGKMISLANTNNGFLQCNDFDRGTAVSYAGNGTITGITGVEFLLGVTLNNQGAGSKAAGNKWSNFGSTYKRVRSTTNEPLGINYLWDGTNSRNPNNLSIFILGTGDLDCSSMQGLMAHDEEEEGHTNNDLSKDGGNEIDSLATYETIYDSSATVADLYADANQFLLALEAVEAGLLDSNSVIENFLNTAVYQVYSLEAAMATGDSTAILTASSNLPSDIVGDNYKIVALIDAKSTDWTAGDSLDLNYVAYQRVDEGGPAAINARNILQIYVDEATLPSNGKSARKKSVNGYLVNVAPNPNNGSFTLTTNIPAQSNIKIMDSLGKTLIESKSAGVVNTIKVDQLVEGLYHLLISDVSGKMINTTFVITK